MKNILVTGGCGVIGSHLVDALVERDYSVTIIDNLSTGKTANIERHLSNPKVQFINDTITNESLMDELIRQCSMVYHLAAAVGVRIICDEPLQGILTNVRGTEIVFNTAFKYWKRVLFTSSSEIYGKSNQLPFQEDGDRLMGSTAVDRWSYATSKAVDEHLAFAYSSKGLPMSIVRYFNSYGPRVDERGYGSVVANFISQALRGQPITVHGDGKQTRCFTFIDDIVAGTILAGERPEAVGQVFNIGNATESSIIELAERINTLLGGKSEIKFIPYNEYYGESYEDTPRRVPDNSKALRMLGFKPSVELETGLARTIEWAKQNYAR